MTSRVTRSGSFDLPCDPATALPLFTPEGERRWVDGWAPVYHSAATDEVGAVWTTAAGAPTTWVTVVRDDDRVAYARVSADGTAGMVQVRCLASGTGATTVDVTYDLTATDARGQAHLEDFARGYAELLEDWRERTRRVLA
jgi:hypothetical protein